MRRHLVTRGSFYERLADQGHEIVVDEDFVDLYAERRGRPSVPPSVMVRAMLCATHDRTSDAETSRRTRVDADWKAAMGVDDEFGGIGATTFSLMRARMVAHDADSELFKATLAKAVGAGIFKGSLTAIIDSSPVHGAGAVADTYELIRGFLAKVLGAAGGVVEGETRRGAESLCAAKADIDWHDPAARRAHLGELVATARAVLADVDGTQDPALREAADLLGRVVDQDVEAGDDGEPVIRHGVARDRIVSHSTRDASRPQVGVAAFRRPQDGPDQRRGLRADLGVDVRAGNAGDGDGAAPLLRRVQDLDGVEIDTLLGDMAYSDGDVREAVEEAGAELVAKVPPATNGGRFPKTDFAIDTRAATVTCPAGRVTSDARKAKDHKGRRAALFVFAEATCAACPMRAQCTTSKGGRRIMVGRHDRIAAARAAQADPATGAASPSGQGGTQDRPPPRSRDAQAPLPRPTQDQTPGVAGRHCRQLQAPRRSRRVRHHSTLSCAA